MSDHPHDTFYIPLLLGVAALLVGFGLPALGVTVSHSIAWTLNVSAPVLVIAAGILAYRTRKKSVVGRGGRGGSATTVGDGNTAHGGKGGNANGGIGGDGGHAAVRGSGSVARGGDGGAG